MALFEFGEVAELTETLKQVRNVYPKEVRQFMMREGTKLKNRTLKKAKASVKKRSGNFFKGIKRGKYYKYKGETDSIRVYGTSPHTHLIEYGHGGSAPARAFHIFSTAGDDFNATYDKDCEKFAEKIAKKLE